MRRSVYLLDKFHNGFVLNMASPGMFETALFTEHSLSLSLSPPPPPLSLSLRLDCPDQMCRSECTEQTGSSRALALAVPAASGHLHFELLYTPAQHCELVFFNPRREVH